MYSMTFYNISQVYALPRLDSSYLFAFGDAPYSAQEIKKLIYTLYETNVHNYK